MDAIKLEEWRTLVQLHIETGCSIEQELQERDDHAQADPEDDIEASKP